MINALQHVGQGVWNIDTTYAFYKRLLGFKVKLNDLTVASKEMEPVIGSVETMRMMMAVNPKGGGVLELIEHKSSPIRPFPADGPYGSYGVLEVGYGVRAIEKVVSHFTSLGVPFLTPICDMDLGNGRRWRYTYLKDPDGLRLQLTEELGPGGAPSRKAEVLGVVHVGIGVSDVERARAFYETALGFDRTVYTSEGHFKEMDPVTGGPLPFKLAVIERSAPASGAISLLPSGRIKLFEVPGGKGRHIYKGRRWGDIGCMEFCMDVTDLIATVAEIRRKGISVYLPPVEINMGSGSKGMVAYIRDPDGTIIEFVEIRSVAWLSPSRFMRLAVPLLRLYDRVA